MKLTSASQWLHASSLGALAFAVASAGIGSPLQAQITPVNTNTQLHNAGNGVPVVNIAAPNANGLSVNQYNDYNVTASGLILNNATAAQGNAQGQVTTQLAGLISTNPNLSTPASAILNEVVSTNPSVLAGFTEVAGSRADVIVANPNGITCGGCGVINTAAFTLTTGMPTIDGNGNLTGFSIQAGTLTINGAGLNASTTDYAALLGRKIVLQGPSYATVLDVVAGANAWNYTTHTATPIAGTGTTPDYAIDSSALGGMYANAIRLIATDQGVGVRLLGDAAASASDLTITAAGDIVLGSALSAQGNLTITSTATDATALSATDASLSSGGNLTISTAGATSLTGGALVASGNLSLGASSLTDLADSATLTNNNQRYAGGTLTLTVGGAGSLTNVSYGASGNVSGQFASLADNGFGYLYSNKGTLALTATSGDLALGGYALSSAGDLSLIATSGAISAGGNLTLTDATGGSSESLNLTATGTLLTAGTLSASLASLTNAGGTIQADLGTTLTATTLTNGGVFIASTNAADSGTLTLGTLGNTGTLQSANALTLHLATTLTNSGTLLAAQGLTIDGTAAATNQSAGAISAGTISASLASLSNAGNLLASGNLGLTISGDLGNSGVIGANGTITASALTLENLSPAPSGGSKPVAAIQSAVGGSLTITNGLTNDGDIYLANTSGSGTISAGTITNQTGGVFASQAGLTLDLSGASLDNSGEILAGGSLTLSGTGTALAITNEASAYLQAGSASGDTLTIDGTGVGLATKAGSVVTGNTLALTLAGLTNAGTLDANAGLTYTVSGDVGNSGAMVAGGLLQGSSTNLTNASGGGIQGSGGVTLTATASLANSGTILTPGGSGANLTLSALTLTNASGAYLQSDHALGLTISGASLGNSGTISSSGNLGIHGTGATLAITNNASGIIAALGPVAQGASVTTTPATLTIDGTATSLTNATGGTMVGDHLALTLAALENDGTLAANLGANTLTIAGALDNTGTLTLSADAAGSGTITADSLTNSGTLASNNALTLNLTSALTNTGALEAVGALSIALGTNSATLSNSGTSAQIAAGGALTITGANASLTNGTAGVFASPPGTVSGGSITVTLASLTNYGTMVSGGNFGLTLGGALNNDNGELGAAGTLTASVGTATNEAVIQSDVGGSLTVSGDLYNQLGTWVQGNIFLAQSSGNATINAAGLTQGTGSAIASQGNLTFNLSGGSLTNNGTIYAANTIAFDTTGALAITNQQAGIIETAAPTGTPTAASISFSGTGLTLTNEGNAGSKGLILGNLLDLSLASFTNQGTIESRGDFTISGSGALSNGGTLYASSGTLTITSGGFTNLSGGIVQADTGATLTLTGDFSNAGTLIGSTDGKGDLAISGNTFSSTAGTIQSSNGLSLNFDGGTYSNAGTILSDGAMTLLGSGTITNSGTIAAQAPSGAASPALLTIGANGDTLALQNQSGGAIAGDQFSFYLSSLNNAGKIVGGSNTHTINIYGDFTNSGTFYTPSLGQTNINVETFENLSGGLFEPYDLTLNLATSFANSGTVYVPGNLSLGSVSLSGSTWVSGTSASVTVTNSLPASPKGTDGLIQVGGTLTYENMGSHLMDVTNNTGATVLAGGVTAYLDALTNDGTLQSTAGSSNYTIINAFSNSGTAIFSGVAAPALPDTSYGLINAGSISNSGKLESYDSLYLTAGAGFTNTASGSIVANYRVYTYATGSQTLNNYGTISAGTSLDIEDTHSVYFGPNAIATAQSFYYNDLNSIGSYSLELDNGASISATSSLVINTNTLLLDGSSSRILGETVGNAGSFTGVQINVGSDFTNNGAIYSGQNLGLGISGSLTNAATGGIIAVGDLGITSSSQITNLGEIYGGNSVTLSATNEIWNEASTTNAAANTVDLGSIDSGGSITLTTGPSYNNFTGTVLNNSAINATGDITINTTTFTNAVAGDWSRATTTVNGTPQITSTIVPTPTGIVINGTGIKTGTDQQNWYWNDSTYTTFNNGLSAPNYTPQIVSQSGTLTINDFTTGTNLGGTLSAPAIVLNGATGATFSEDTLALTNAVTDNGYYVYGIETVGYVNGSVISDTTVWSTTKNCSFFLGGVCGSNGIETLTTVYTTNNAPQNGIFATNLTGSNFGLTLNGSPNTVNFSAPSTPSGGSAGSVSGGASGTSGTTASVNASGATGTTGASGTSPTGGSLTTVTPGTTASTGGTTKTSGTSGASGQPLPSPVSGTTVNGKPAVTISGTTITLPTNPNGLFVIAPGNNNQYLVESNPLYTLPATDLSSNLLDQLLGLNPDELGERLGDANYEAYVISQQLLGQTGNALLAGYGNLNSELSALYTNAASDAGSLGLVYGQPLSAAQVAALPNDMIWMVSTVVDGQTVLAPVVYLSPATKASLVTGSGIIADNVNLNLTSLTNNGGAIVGTQTNVITASGDINNTGSGLLAGGQVYLQSTNGVVNNLSSTIAGVQSAVVVSNGDLTNTGGTITAQDIGLKSVNGGINLTAGTITAGNALAIDVKNDIDINGTNNISGQNLSLTTHGGSINVITQTQTYGSGNTITTVVGPTASITATQSLALNAADNINVAGGNISAGQDLSLVAGNNINIGTITTTSASASSSNHGNTKSSTTSTGNIGSTVSAGNDLYMQSGGSTNITGSTVSAGGDAAIVANGGLNVSAATDTSSTTTTVKHHNLFQSSTKTTTVDTATDASSSIQVGGNLVVQTNADINITGGSQLGVGGNLVTDTNGHAVNVVAGNNVVTTDITTKKSGLFVGGGLYGKTSKTTTDTATTNDASGITVGGEADLVNNASINLVGSNLSAAGGGILQATNGINILAGANTDAYTSHSVSECVLCVSSTSSGTKSSSASASSSWQDGSGSASVSAAAAASGQNSSSLNLYSKTVTDTRSNSSTSVGSNVSFGGNALISGGNTLTIQGSNVSTTNGADLTLSATNVNILAAANTSTSATSSKTLSIGAFVDSQGSATASAGAGVTGNIKKGIGGSINANASASAAGTTTLTLGARESTSNSTSDILTYTGSNVSADNNLTIIAGNTLTTAGSSLSTNTGNLTEIANNISNLAVIGHDYETTSATQNTQGLFLSAGGTLSGTAAVNGGVNLTSGGLAEQVGTQGAAGKNSASFGAEVQLNLNAGIGITNTSSGSVNNSTTVQSSTLTAGGDIVRIANNTITDQGTQLSAGGNINQSAQTIVDQAVANTSFQTSSSKSNSFTIGVGASAGLGVGNAYTPITGIGVTEGDTYAKSNTGSASSTAVTTSYQAGGSVNSYSSGNTTLLGANIVGGQGVNITAGSLDYQAATNTSTQTGNTQNAAKSVMVSKKALTGSGSYTQGNTTTTTVTQTGGQIISGSGAVNITTTNGDMNLTGTQIYATNGTNLVAQNGNVNLLAAQTITTATSTSAGGGGMIGVGKGGGKGMTNGNMVAVSGSDTTTTSVTTTNQGVGILSLIGPTNIVGNNVTLQGAQVASVASDVNVTATNGTVNQNSTTDTTVTTTQGFNVALQAQKNVKTGKTGITDSGGVSDITTTQNNNVNATSLTSILGNVNVTQGTGLASPVQPQLAGPQTQVTLATLPQQVAANTVTLTNPASGILGQGVPGYTPVNPTGGAGGTSLGPGVSGGGILASGALQQQAIGTSPAITVTPVGGLSTVQPVVPVGGGITLSVTPVSGVRAINPKLQPLPTLGGATPASLPQGAPLVMPTPGAVPFVNGPSYTSTTPTVTLTRKVTITQGTPTPTPTPTATPTPKPTPTPTPTATPVITLPNGTQYSSAQQLPCWLMIDPRTGAISGHPSKADAAADVPVIIIEQVPQPNGTVRSISISVKPDQFGIGGSQCSMVRTNPASKDSGHTPGK